MKRPKNATVGFWPRERIASVFKLNQRRGVGENNVYYTYIFETTRAALLLKILSGGIGWHDQVDL